MINNGINDDYKLIPMNEIESEAREIAIRWAGDSGMDWIGDKHKLASDIMNYSRRQFEKLGINRPIIIDGKNGVITNVNKLSTGITIVYVDFEKPNLHWKIYTLGDIIRVVGSDDAIANINY